METGVRKEKGFVWESCSLDDDYRCFQCMAEVIVWMIVKACRRAVSTIRMGSC
jgi:hypothetical protein